MQGCWNDGFVASRFWPFIRINSGSKIDVTTILVNGSFLSDARQLTAIKIHPNPHKLDTIYMYICICRSVVVCAYVTPTGGKCRTVYLHSGIATCGYVSKIFISTYMRVSLC